MVGRQGSRWALALIAGTLICGCEEPSPPDAEFEETEGGKSDAVDPSGSEGEDYSPTVVEVYDVASFNEDLDPSLPTANLAFFLTEEGHLSWEYASQRIENARAVFAEVGVQLRVAYAVNLDVPSDWQNLDPYIRQVPTLDPQERDRDFYARYADEAPRFTERNENIFHAMLGTMPAKELGIDPANTVLVMDLNRVTLPFYEFNEDTGEWDYDEAGTSGLSFAPYTLADRIPRDLRGVITSSWGALAHELGHKLINVSHEGVGQCPAFVEYGEDLMLYGSGTRIPGGEEGRWQQERLHLSPFLYTERDGVAEFNVDYEEGGHYSDPIYGEYAVTPACP